MNFIVFDSSFIQEEKLNTLGKSISYFRNLFVTAL